MVPEEFFARTRCPVDAILERSTRIVGLVLAPGGTPGFEAAAAQSAAEPPGCAASKGGK